MYQHEVWDPNELINTQLCLNISLLLFFLLMYLNYRLYGRKNKKSHRKIKTRYSKRSKGTNAKNIKSKINLKKFISKLFLITIFKCLLMAIIFLAIKQKQSPEHKHKFLKKGYFLSIEHYRDSYRLSELQVKSDMEWYAMSKLKLKTFSYFQMLFMLSGDIAINLGPASDPTLTSPASVENNALPFNGSKQSLNEQSFEFREEHLSNVSLADEAQWFNKKGLHFVHLNSLIDKIEEIREFVLKCKPHVICYSESKLDDSVTDTQWAQNDNIW